MKRKLIAFIALMLVFVTTTQVVLLADEIMPLNNNTLATYTSFIISSSGEAIVVVDYEGYPNITSGATINITIKKRTLLLFWSEVVSDSITVSGEYYSNEFYYQLEDKGTYKCNVEYIVSGTMGADDVIPFEDTAVYE